MSIFSMRRLSRHFKKRVVSTLLSCGLFFPLRVAAQTALRPSPFLCSIISPYSSQRLAASSPFQNFSLKSICCFKHFWKEKTWPFGRRGLSAQIAFSPKKVSQIKTSFEKIVFWGAGATILGMILYGGYQIITLVIKLHARVDQLGIIFDKAPLFSRKIESFIGPSFAEDRKILKDISLFLIDDQGYRTRFFADLEKLDLTNFERIVQHIGTISQQVYALSSNDQSTENLSKVLKLFPGNKTS